VESWRRWAARSYRRGSPRQKVNPQAAADQVLKLYDTDGDSKLSKGELAKCPGILANIELYDQTATVSSTATKSWKD